MEIIKTTFKNIFSFTSLLIVTTLAIASCAAFFSVYGLAHIFAGAFWSVIAMGVALEAGKLMAASFVYRYRKTLNFAMKSYLVIAIVILMAITSTGIFGYLSKGYQEDTVNLNQMKASISALVDERTLLEGKVKRVEFLLDEQLQKLPSDWITKTERAVNQAAKQTKPMNMQIIKITSTISDLKTKLVTVESHVGPIIFIAKALGREPDDATFYLLLLLMIVFDPLAVVMTLACNMVLMEKKRERGDLIEEDIIEEPIIEEPIPEITTPLPKPPLTEGSELHKPKPITPAPIAPPPAPIPYIKPPKNMKNTVELKKYLQELNKLPSLNEEQLREKTQIELVIRRESIVSGLRKG